MTGATCATCRFWEAEPVVTGSFGGYCQRFPPTLCKPEAANDEDREWFWPETATDDWCGEHQPKEIPPCPTTTQPSPTRAEEPQPGASNASTKSTGSSDARPSPEPTPRATTNASATPCCTDPPPVETPEIPAVKAWRDVADDLNVDDCDTLIRAGDALAEVFVEMQRETLAFPTCSPDDPDAVWERSSWYWHDRWITKDRECLAETFRRAAAEQQRDLARKELWEERAAVDAARNTLRDLWDSCVAPPQAVREALRHLDKAHARRAEQATQDRGEG